MKLILDIPKEMNKKLKIIKIQKDFNNLQNLILAIINKFLKEDIEEENNNGWNWIRKSRRKPSSI